jgi:hypothetical protein
MKGLPKTLRLRIVIGSATILALGMCLPPSLVADAKSGTLSKVPFVGCRSDGQAGPLEAPKGIDKVMPISAEVAHRLAYYKAEQGPGVLAPRGWYCFATYGSNGSTLYVAPQPIDEKGVFSNTWAGFEGPAIQLTGEDGGTSGRFSVAAIIARVFPAHRDFVQHVIKEGIEPAKSFPRGPYPLDKLTYKSNEIVEYQTPAEEDGLGTRSRLKKNGNPINGVAVLSGPSSEPSLSLLSTRLPIDLNDLSPAITQQVEREAVTPDH